MTKELLNSWIPVAFSADVRTIPIKLEVVSKLLLIWRNENNTLSVVSDRCIHKGASLSRGTIRNNRVECPYHGWQYDGNGFCYTNQSRANEDSAMLLVPCRYFAMEYQEIIWITRNYLAPFPISKELSQNIHICYKMQDSVQCNAYDLIENSLDLHHFPFVHANTFSPGNCVGSGAQTAFYKYTDYGFECSYSVPIQPGGLFAKHVFEAPCECKVVMKYFAPLTQVFYVEYSNGISYSSLTCALPVNENSSSILQLGFNNGTGTPIDDTDFFRADWAIWLEDKAILETIQRDTEPDWLGWKLNNQDEHSLYLANALFRYHKSYK